MQADATAWMAFYCTTMLAMALELAKDEPPYADLALKFFEHFVAIAKAMNTLGGDGLWSERDGFYYDLMSTDAGPMKLRIRSMVGLVPLFAAESLDDELITQLPIFEERLRVVLREPARARAHDLDHSATRITTTGCSRSRAAQRLERVLKTVLDETEFLSPYGIRSLSRVHARQAVRPAHRRPRATRSTTRPARATRGCSAATRTGAARCGSRSTTC